MSAKCSLIGNRLFQQAPLGALVDTVARGLGSVAPSLRPRRDPGHLRGTQIPRLLPRHHLAGRQAPAAARLPSDRPAAAPGSGGIPENQRSFSRTVLARAPGPALRIVAAARTGAAPRCPLQQVAVSKRGQGPADQRDGAGCLAAEARDGAEQLAQVLCAARAWLAPSAAVRFCRNEYFIRAHIYARTGILTHALATLSVIAVQPFHRSGRESGRIWTAEGWVGCARGVMQIVLFCRPVRCRPSIVSRVAVAGDRAGPTRPCVPSPGQREAGVQLGRVRAAARSARRGCRAGCPAQCGRRGR